MSKLLQAIGVLALLAFTGAGVGAWFLTKEQVHFTIEEGAGRQRAVADPSAELGDRMDSLQEDLRGLARSLSRNFEVLDGAASERAAEGASASATTSEEILRELARIERELEARFVRALERERERGAAELVALRAELAALRGELLSSGAAPAQAAIVSEPPEAAESRVAAANEDRATTAVDAAAPAPSPASNDQEAIPRSVVTPKKKRSFVAFDLPSDAFAFEGRRTWEIVPSLSRVGFDAKSTLHDFTGATQKLKGEWTADLAHPEVDPQGSIAVESASLDTGLPDRNSAMGEKLETAKHASIAFEVLSFRTKSIDAHAMKVAGVVRGKLRIRGVEQEIEMPVRLAVDDSRRLSVDGETTVKMSSFGIEPPSQLGMISVQDQVEIWIALRARSSGAKPR